MTIVQKQVYESNFNMIGYFLKEAYEKSTGAKKKQIANLIGNINQMYLYTNMLETENYILQSREDEVNYILQSREDEVNNDRLKWAERARVAEQVIFKNDKTIRPEGV
jgi:hypothetical protein